MNVDDFLPEFLVQAHRRQLNHLTTLSKVSQYKDISLVDFEGNLKTPSGSIRILPRVHDGISAVILMVFNNEDEGGRLIANSMLEILAIDTRLASCLFGSFPDQKPNLATLGCEMHLAVSLLVLAANAPENQITRVDPDSENRGSLTRLLQAMSRYNETMSQAFSGVGVKFASNSWTAGSSRFKDSCFVAKVRFFRSLGEDIVSVTVTGWNWPGQQPNSKIENHTSQRDNSDGDDSTNKAISADKAGFLADYFESKSADNSYLIRQPIRFSEAVADLLEEVKKFQNESGVLGLSQFEHLSKVVACIRSSGYNHQRETMITFSDLEVSAQRQIQQKKPKKNEFKILPKSEFEILSKKQNNQPFTRKIHQLNSQSARKIVPRSPSNNSPTVRSTLHRSYSLIEQKRQTNHFKSRAEINLASSHLIGKILNKVMVGSRHLEKRNELYTYPT